MRKYLKLKKNGEEQKNGRTKGMNNKHWSKTDLPRGELLVLRSVLGEELFEMNFSLPVLKQPTKPNVKWIIYRGPDGLLIPLSNST